MILQQPFAIPNFAFTPPKISGLRVWYKADAITAHSNNDPVSTWSDLSGNGNDLLQASGTSQPLYKTNIINSLPTVLFDGSNDFMSFTTGFSALPGSFFVVTQPTLNTASQKSYACISHSSGASGYFVVARLSTDFWGTYTGTDLSSTNALTSGTNYLLENTFTTNSTFLYQKGVQVATRTTTEIASGSPGAVGKDITNANREYAGHIAEIIVYNSVLSSGNRALVENYLIAKWAL